VRIFYMSIVVKMKAAQSNAYDLYNV